MISAVYRIFSLAYRNLRWCVASIVHADTMPANNETVQYYGTFNSTAYKPKIQSENMARQLTYPIPLFRINVSHTR